MSEKVKHIYFGANQSFPNPTAITLASINIWKEWETIIHHAFQKRLVRTAYEKHKKQFTVFRTKKECHFVNYIEEILPKIEIGVNERSKKIVKKKISVIEKKVG